ncbi:hypothetical protein [Streptomyces sp. B8F3]|uniref:hypothetical protein n=1 Tax=unclassified Streptomyces TaxID=2593676 RepID=UPI00325CDA66
MAHGDVRGGGRCTAAYVLLGYAYGPIGDSRLDVTGDLHYGVLVCHVLTAFVALVLGPLRSCPRSGPAAASTGRWAVPVSSPECFRGR